MAVPAWTGLGGINVTGGPNGRGKRAAGSVARLLAGGRGRDSGAGMTGWTIGGEGGGECVGCRSLAMVRTPGESLLRLPESGPTVHGKEQGAGVLLPPAEALSRRAF